MASAMGVQVLLKSWKIRSAIAYGGFIGRAENRAMLNHLEIEAVPVNGLELSDFDRVVYVDTQPGAGNQSLSAEMRKDAVIDHHPIRIDKEKVPFVDIREEMGATSTIVSEYLRKAKVEINYKLATGLYYGIKSDTLNLTREVTAVDRETYHYLFSRIDHRLLVQIETPPLERDFFEAITLAYRSLDIFEKYGWCYLGKISRPDIVAEMADLFARIGTLEWMVCVGYLKNTLYFSVRTKSVKEEAGDVAREMVKGEKGSAGGHGQMAAGRIESPKRSNELLFRLKTRYLEILKTAESPAEESKEAEKKE
jgi:nanoRNase/pAp phosphatase (c-di-AMP/oligoRNAs hydrolase)